MTTSTLNVTVFFVLSLVIRVRFNAPDHLRRTDTVIAGATVAAFTGDAEAVAARCDGDDDLC